MWNVQSNNDILDFALLWQPLGGPGPQHVATAFAIDIREYHDRLRGAVSHQLSRFQQHGAASPECIYDIPTITALAPDAHTSGDHQMPGRSRHSGGFRYAESDNAAA